MKKPPCAIGDCSAEAVSEFTVNDNDLLAVYAVCPDHLTAIRTGAMFAASAHPARGLLGLRADNDTPGER